MATNKNLEEALKLYYLHSITDSSALFDSSRNYCVHVTTPKTEYAVFLKQNKNPLVLVYAPDTHKKNVFVNVVIKSFDPNDVNVGVLLKHVLGKLKMSRVMAYLKRLHKFTKYGISNKSNVMDLVKCLYVNQNLHSRVANCFLFEIGGETQHRSCLALASGERILIPRDGRDADIVESRDEFIYLKPDPKHKNPETLFGPNEGIDLSKPECVFFMNNIIGAADFDRAQKYFIKMCMEMELPKVFCAPKDEGNKRARLCESNLY